MESETKQTAMTTRMSKAIRLGKLLLVAHMLIFLLIALVHFFSKIICKECVASISESFLYTLQFMKPWWLIISPGALLFFPFGTLTYGLSIYLLFLTWKKWSHRVVYIYMSVALLIMYLWLFFFDAMGRG